MSGKTLYLEGASGISGDMAVGALLDLGADREKLLRVLDSLGVDGFRVAIGRKSSYGIAGTDFDVALDGHGCALEDDDRNRSLHLHEGGHDVREGRPHHHCHGHEGREGEDGHGTPGHAHGHCDHVHRNLDDVMAIIGRGQMTERARTLAGRIFRIVAEAESKAHGVPVEQVHFHEVGAIDSIVDIVSAAVCIDDLDVTDCVVTGLREGTGEVMCQHGLLPVPVPAVLNIAQSHRIPLRIDGGVRGEMVTPTGIAIAASLRTREALPSEFTVERVGIGLGKRDFGRPNILRAMVLAERPAPEQVWMLECNVDDATGEELGLAMERLMAAGARDVHFIPCFMKKNRPGWLLRVLCDGALVPELRKILFRDTTTIGVRQSKVERTCMDRRMETAHLPEGDVAVKVCSYEGVQRRYPEYESVKAASEKSGASWREIYAKAATSPDRGRPASD